ncbi:hypothetical protein CR970_02790 [Candidatus Saccharibacteria bacterium]|nr:MAG: hypothetical protein CR970_02790 [Candidatus Saccharibacteria bacterium]
MTLTAPPDITDRVNPEPTAERIVLVVNPYKTKRPGDVPPDDMLEQLSTANPSHSVEPLDVRAMENHLSRPETAQHTTYATIGGDGTLHSLANALIRHGRTSTSTIWPFTEGGASEVAKMCGAEPFSKTDLHLERHLHTACVRPIRHALHTTTHLGQQLPSWEEVRDTKPDTEIYALYTSAIGNVAVGSVIIDSKAFRETTAGKHELRRMLREAWAGIRHINTPFVAPLVDKDNHALRLSSIMYANGPRLGRYGRLKTDLFRADAKRLPHGVRPEHVWMDVSRLVLGRARSQTLKPDNQDVVGLPEGAFFQADGEPRLLPPGWLHTSIATQERSIRFIVDSNQHQHTKPKHLGRLLSFARPTKR